MIVKLGTVISEISIRNKQDEDIPVYSVTNDQGFCTGYFNKDVSSKDRTTYKIVPYGCFAYNPSRINVGSVDWQHYEDRVIVSPLYVVFKTADALDQRYLLHYLKSDIALTLIRANASGSVRDNLKFSTLKEFPINLRSLDEQKVIADHLDKIDVLTNLYHQQLTSLDELVKSRFIEMFGDPIVNDKQWIQTALKAVCCKITDGEHGSVPRVEQGYPFLNAKHILRDGTIDWKDVSCISRDVYEKLYKRCKPEKNDILMTTTGTIGNVAIVSTFKPFSMDRGITLLKTNSEQVNSQFIAYLLRFEGMQAIMSANVHASAIGHLFLNKVEQLPVILPPLKLQQQFAAFVAEVDKSKHFSELEVAA